MINATKVIHADRVSLFLVDYDKTPNELYAYVSKSVPSIRLPFASGLVGSCATNRKVLRISDAHQDPRFNKDFDVSSGYRTKSVLCVPMLGVKGEIMGVLQALNKKSSINKILDF